MILAHDHHTVTYKCKYSSEIFTRTCVNGSKWLPENLPRCKSQMKTFCPLPPFIPSTRTRLTGFEVGSTATYKCIDGYTEAVGVENVASCLNNYQWSYIDYHCTRLLFSYLSLYFSFSFISYINILNFKVKLCSKSLILPNGNIRYSGDRYKNLAVYKCNYGYKLKPNVIYNTCLNGVWIMNVIAYAECLGNWLIKILEFLLIY